MSLTDLLGAHPGAHDVPLEVLAECIAACGECATACAACADACLDEEGVADLVTCIRSDLTCADLCAVTAQVLSRRPVTATVVESLVRACLEACRACAVECEQHAGHHEHCRLCAEACRRCEAACQRLLDVIAAG